MNNINRPVPDMDGYIIKSCTHNGVWLVEHTDQETSEKKLYDFVNKDILPNDGGDPHAFITMGDGFVHDMKTLHKNINRALVR